MRADFRGVGGSSGRSDDGTGEVEDAAGALDWLSGRPAVDGQRLGLAGFSFGAMVARRRSFVDPRGRALALIAPPLSWEPTTAVHLKLEKIGVIDYFIIGYEDRVGASVARFMAARCSAG